MISRIATICPLLALALALAGCGARPAAAPAAGAATPTIAPLFQDRPSATPFVAPPTATPAPPRPTATPEPSEAIEDLTVIPVYRDALSAGWTVSNSALLADLTLTEGEVVGAGRYAVGVEPSESTGTLYFTVERGSGIELLRDRVIGLRLRLSGGGGPIANDAMTISVVGSNEVPYWVADDDSVVVEGRVTDSTDLIFSETRLYFLGLNRAIAPGEWVEIYVWLNDLIYDPTYTYITGFYLKTSAAEVERYYVDQIDLLATR